MRGRFSRPLTAAAVSAISPCSCWPARSRCSSASPSPSSPQLACSRSFVLMGLYAIVLGVLLVAGAFQVRGSGRGSRQKLA